MRKINNQPAQAKDMLALVTENASCRGKNINFYAEPIPYEVRTMCADCPVEKECLDYALHYERYGFWGGASESDRLRIRKALHIRLLDSYTRQPHGREAPNATIITYMCGLPGTKGWRAHKKRGEQPCKVCLDNYNVTKAERKSLKEQQRTMI